MCKTAKQVAIMVMEIERTTMTIEHTDEGSTTPPPAQYNPKQWHEDFCIQVGHSMFQSLRILGLGLGASETEFKVHYCQLAGKYYPDKNETAITGLAIFEASIFFSAYLKDRA